MTQLELLEQLEQTEPVHTTLTSRGEQYGNFATQAQLSQTLQAIWKQHYFQVHPKGQLPNFVLEAVSMILHKLARAANGDPLYIDNFRDIAGYSQLVVDLLATYPGATDATVTKTTNPSDKQWEHY